MDKTAKTPVEMKEDSLDELSGGPMGYMKIGDIEGMATQSTSFDLTDKDAPHPRDRMILNWGGENSI